HRQGPRRPPRRHLPRSAMGAQGRLHYACRVLPADLTTSCMWGPHVRERAVAAANHPVWLPHGSRNECLVAVFVVALATWRWRTGRTPLIVERSGRVYRAYPSVTNAPRMAPAATPLIDPAVNQPHARARGMGAWILVPNPTEVPRIKPSSRPARSDFGLTRSR